MDISPHSDSWFSGTGFPNRLFDYGSDDFELYEEDGEFVLSLELPGYDPEEITLTWDDGILNVAAETDGESPGTRGTYHRRFRFPKRVDDEAIAAEYTNGILKVRLPVMEQIPVSGTEIEVHS